MSDLSQMSDDQLRKIASASDLSDEELKGIAGFQTKQTHPENILQRAARVIKPMMDTKYGVGMGGVIGAENMKHELGSMAFPDNPVGQGAFDVVADPMTWGGNPLETVPKAASSAGKFIGGAAKEVGGTLKSIPNVLTKSSRVKTVEGFKNALSSKRWTEMPKEFGQALDSFMSSNPEKSINLRGLIESANQQAEMNPNMRTLLGKDPFLSGLSKNPELAENLSLADAQKIKTSLGAHTPEAIKSGAKVSPLWRESLDFIQGLGKSIKDTFPEMEATYSKYAKNAENYKKFAPKFRSNQAVENILGSRNLLSFVRNPSFAGGEAGEMALKDFSPEIYSAAKNSRRANSLINAAKIGAIGSAIEPFAWPIVKGVKEITD